MADRANAPAYNEESIQALKPMEHIRLRPGMYVGGTDLRALHHLIYEVVDNAIDEALAGRCDRITITLHDDNMVTVADNGVGIPVGVHKKEGISRRDISSCGTDRASDGQLVWTVLGDGRAVRQRPRQGHDGHERRKDATNRIAAS